MKNNNQGISYKLAWQSLKTSKLRNIFMCITIVLSVSLLAGTAFFVSATYEEELKALSERQHMIYHKVTDEQIKGIREEDQISRSTVTKQGKSFEVDNYILVPSYLENNENGIMQLELSEGEHPTAYNQIVVDTRLLELMGIPSRVGEEITIEFLDGTIEMFEVTGTITREEDTNLFVLYLSEDYARNGSQLKNIPFDLAAQVEGAEQMSGDECLDIIREIGGKHGVARQNINEHNNFIYMLSFWERNIIGVLLVGMVTLLVSVLVIYSIFYLSISERTRQFGQLRTIGMTKKQIKKMVYMEGSLLSIVGSIVGIMIGITFAYVMQPEWFNIRTVMIYTVVILIVNYVTVRISITKPAKIAANISPVEAAKYSGYDNSTNQGMTKKLHRNLSPLSLSGIAASGNRKKSRMTVISLSLAGVVFMCASTYLHSINEEQFARQSWFEYGEYVFNLSWNAVQVNELGDTGIKIDNPLNDKLIEEIEAIDGVNDIIAMENLGVQYSYKDVQRSNDVVAPFSEEEAYFMQEYMTDGTLDYNEMIKNREILICKNEIAKEIFGWKFKVGDEVAIEWYNGEEYIEELFTIVGEVDSRALYSPEIGRTVYNAGWFLVPDQLLDQMMIPGFNLIDRIIISANDYANKGTEIEAALYGLEAVRPLISLSTLSDRLEHSKIEYERIYNVIMGATLFIMAFSLINLVNTLITNIMSRKREFACLRTLGMSEKQVATMIQGEGIYLGIINILVTVTVGSLSGYLLVALMNYQGIRYMEYQFPVSYLLGYIGVVLIVPVIISQVLIKRLGKKSLVERLREIE